nr:hypothetical protein GCM10020185_46090 [Pseudomonas brassicacearum subsp. brassicacearum]
MIETQQALRLFFSRGLEASALTSARALLKVSLAAIPLLFEGQRPVTGQVYAAMGATDHGRCVLLAGSVRRGGAPLNLRQNHTAAAIRAIQNSKRSMMGGFFWLEIRQFSQGQERRTAQ